MTAVPPSPDEFAEALRLFDETTRALDARARRLEEVLTVKQRQLEDANRRLAEQLSEVHRLGSNLDLLLESVASGVLAVDCAGRVTACNPAAGMALGVQAAAAIARPLDELLPDLPMSAVLGSGDPCDLELRYRTPEGEERRLAARLAPIRDRDGVITGAVAIFDDITEVLRLRERAERGERLRALGEMAAGVAHEIRNPLNGIQGFASLLQRDLSSDDARQRHVGAIISGVSHLNDTVSGLLAFTRAKEPQRRPTPIVELVHNCCELVRAESVAGDPVPELVIVDAWGEARLECDPTQIRQVLLNLIQNGVQAVAATDDVPQVCISLRRLDDGSCECCVDDNGPGVPEHERAKLFTPFYTTKDHGTGLGLAVSHTLVNLHGGSLEVDDAPDGGARFRLTLPPR
ncbi:MAG: two-component system sensor histidine kinase NtrB [Planctomycetota bacterium]